MEVLIITTIALLIITIFLLIWNGKLSKKIEDSTGALSELVDKALFTVLHSALQLPNTYDEFRDLVVNSVTDEVKKLASNAGINISSVSNNEITDIVNITIDSLKLDSTIEEKYNYMVESRLKEIEAEEKKIAEENENMETCEIPQEEEVDEFDGNGIEEAIPEPPIVNTNEIDEVIEKGDAL